MSSPLRSFFVPLCFLGYVHIEIFLLINGSCMLLHLCVCAYILIANLHIALKKGFDIYKLIRSEKYFVVTKLDVICRMFVFRSNLL